MSLWNWLESNPGGDHNRPAAKTPLLPKSSDSVDSSAAAQIDNTVRENSRRGSVGKRRGSYFEYDDEPRTKIVKYMYWILSSTKLRRMT